MNGKIRILLADDHLVVRRGLALVLRQELDFEIVGEAEDGETAVSLAQSLQPDLVLLDWKMPKKEGIEAAQEIQKANPAIRTLVLSGAAVETAVLEAIDNGVDGFVHKDISPAKLAHAIRVVASGEPFLSPEITQALIAHSKQGGYKEVQPTLLGNLSGRELEVLNLMATPATYRVIGNNLGISEETVKTYAKRIFSKLKQSNRTQAVIAALRADIILLD